MATLMLTMYLLFTLLVIYHARSLYVWDIGSLLYLGLATSFGGFSWVGGVLAWSVIGALAVFLHLKSFKSACAVRVFQRLSQVMPTLSATEKQALNAGDPWFERDVFRGTLNWSRLANVSTALTAEEQQFLDHETEELCGLLDEWSIETHNDLSPEVWAYLKEKGFFGLVIAKNYGGRGFSARAHSDIVMKIASRSSVAAVTMMVPNSLGPGELLQHYGTKEQKDYYLPRLANGLELPCFALTEPEAGSDATSIQSEAVVVTEKVDGKSVLGLRLTLNKRWITLAPVATLVGLAVNLKDPQGLLNGIGKEGITCLLISSKTPGLEIGNRHIPSHQPFMNGTIRGQGIFVPFTSIIGGQEQAGNGWHMLVECLSIGRAISLPALSTASSGVAYVSCGAYARIRRQFNVEIGQFEGIQEKLAAIAGRQYLINATRLFTLAAVAEDKRPTVASGIAKYFNTELARMTVNDAMDIHGGRAVVAGPRNYLINFYQGIPVAITVEGANIMSRNLLIFGQGSMACHPYVRAEYEAIMAHDNVAFTNLFWKHLAYSLQNIVKMLTSALTGGWFIFAPKSPLKRAYQRLARLSHAYAWLADFALMYFGANLKRKERLSARLADGLSYLYMAMATLHYAKEHGDNEDQVVHANWATKYCFAKAAMAMQDFCRQLPSRSLGWLLEKLMFPGGQRMHGPTDQEDAKLAQLMMKNNAYREQLKQSLYFSGQDDQPLDRVENALQGLIQCASIYAKMPDLKPFKWNINDFQTKVQEKVQQGVLTPEEASRVLAVEHARWDAIQVDEFKM